MQDTTPYDVTRLRSRFPSLASGTAHFDGPGGTQTPIEVGRAVYERITGPVSNKGTGSLSERTASATMADFREAMGDFLASDPQGIVYGRSATALVYEFAGYLSKSWGPGDTVVVSRLDHDSNVRPWVQAAERAGASVAWIDLDPATGDLDPASAEAVIGPDTVLVAIAAASNFLGTIPPVRRIADLAHSHGALVWVDAVHYAAHRLVDREALGADVLVCSPYKFLGPHCGVLAADPQWLAGVEVDKLAPQTDAVPDRFERGTLPYELQSGVVAAVDFLADLAEEFGGAAPAGTDGAGAMSRRARLEASFALLEEHEDALRERMEAGLAALGEEVVVHSVAAQRTPTVTVTLPGRDVRAAYAHLVTEHDVLAPAGDFYAYEAVRRLGLPGNAGLRMGLAPYSDHRDVDRLLAGLRTFLETTPAAGGPEGAAAGTAYDDALRDLAGQHGGDR
ncbi:cysteine desulfurase-like protein [Brevibacterium litoralis]|uniref:cysteine desulfurase-like protein n=1 Tax=Brevibacterium litoralis TaxID=3138935 RepID=UPI0032EE3123